MKWYYQIVHHPIWNYDLSSPPILADITVDGRKIKAVAVPSKEAFLYVFDRVTGKPVWPIVRAAGSAGQCAGRVVFPDAAIPDQASGLCASIHHAGRADRFHAGAACESTRGG